MGEIAEMYLEGILCEGCGEYLGGDDGIPQRCSGCRSEEAKFQDLDRPKSKQLKKTKTRRTCVVCLKMAPKKELVHDPVSTYWHHAACE